MADKTIPWDAVDYLQTKEDIADYLSAALETGEVPDITHALIKIAQARNANERVKQ